MELELKVNDILQLKSSQSAFFDKELPGWAVEFVIKCPYVVIKRGQEKAGMVAVGIRGTIRKQRFGCYMDKANINKIYKPFELIKRISNCSIWNKAAPLLDCIFETYIDKVTYGPTGSVGFELATGYEATTCNSDLDLLIMVIEPLEIDDAKKLLGDLLKINIPMDITLGLSIGYVVMVEYCNGQPPYLVKTNKGQRLVEKL